ncbi:DUF2516 family protein [Nocardioides sp. AE5]|uniref:DUF2516 family protein n=1 Tax=Nocardioides sp. AE5 TaxID=2962573 RepID=UPI002880FE5A|nr:DUF2516 family protein [Nocardioides sp. AE5]MDT0202654.1 DUF2516 family protein [Nocardioides sp. AE5]
MIEVLQAQSYFMLAITLLALAVKSFAFVNALLWSAEAYVAAGKLTKPAWLAILGLGLGAQLLFIGSSPLGILQLLGAIAAIVYLVDVRPAVAGLTRR